MTSALPASLYTTTANSLLAQLKADHDSAFATSDDAALNRAVRNARTIRRSVLVYRGACEVLDLPESEETSGARSFLRTGLSQSSEALRDGRFGRLASLTDSMQLVLDNLVKNHDGFFTPIDISPSAPVSGTVRNGSKNKPHFPSESQAQQMNPSTAPFDDLDPDPDPDPDDQEFRPGRSFPLFAGPGTSLFRPNWYTSLDTHHRLVLALYVLMVCAAIAAVTAVTINFVHQARNPSGLIGSVQSENLTAPVVTVCLSQTGVPFSRLQLFNFTDATGTDFIGADPTGTYTDRVTPEFAAVVDRFWDNPANENCDEVVGDYFPFPLRSLNRLGAGEISTQCRQCYRVGLKEKASAFSTSFQNSSVLSFFTDNYFLQCQKSVGGLNEESLDFLHQQMFDRRVDMSNLEVLSTDLSLLDESVEQLTLAAFQNATAEQACNIFYFSFFPKLLNRTDSTVDIRYRYNGTAWVPTGQGPYFRIQTAPQGFLPTESLQMFVEAPEIAQENVVRNDSDMILIGPNTQTFATFRRIVVFGSERYDISSSTSNLFQSDITPIFGYWLIYRIYYNFNRFVTDEWYRESTYPVGQYVVDATGYVSLFTNWTLFSLLLVPLLHFMRRRRRMRMLRKRPEGYVWSKHRRELETIHQSSDVFDSASPRNDDISSENASNSLILPGYHV